MKGEFQPILLGTLVSFEHSDETGMITDETLCEVYLESDFYTGWISKAAFWEYASNE